MSATFTGVIKGFAKMTSEDVLAVFRQSADDMADAIVSTTPVDTGNLVSTFLTQINAPLPNADRTDATPLPQQQYSFVISGAVLGDFITMGYTAVYGPRLEFGFVGQDSLGRNINQAPRGWVRAAASKWEEIVDRNASRVKNGN